jgi:hypothetical protein
MLGRWLTPLGVIGVLVSCGGGKQEPAQSAAVAREEPAVAPLPPLVPVAAPAELFAVARIPNAAKTADTGVAWSGLPMNWRGLLDKAVPGLDRAAVLGAPVDFAAMLDPTAVAEPRVEWAFAVGASSTDAAATFLRSQGATVTSEAAGAYRAQIGKDLSCLVVRALGTAPARVVCSDSAVNADALAPYMSCGMTTEAISASSEFHAHVTGEPFRRRYGSQVTLVRTVGVPFLLRELSLDHPKFDRALRDVLYGLADEVIALAYDLDRLDIDATLAPGGNELDVATTLSMGGQRSWWAQTAVAVSGSGNVAPDMFWKLPEDTTAASYTVFSEADRFRGIAASLRELADGWLDYHKVTDRRRTPFAEALEQFISTNAATVSASLPDDAAEAAATSAGAAGHSHADPVESMRATVGQRLFVLDRNGDRVVKFASEFVKVLGDKAFRQHLVTTNVAPATRIPTAKERAPKYPKGLPPQTKAFELQIPASALQAASLMGRSGRGRQSAPPVPEKPGESGSVFLVAMPDGPLTWFALGTDEKAIEARLAEIKAGTAGTLAKREGLGALKTEKAMSAGFSSLASLVASMRSSFGDKAAPTRESLTLLPHKGEAPLLFNAVSDPKGPRLTATARVPRELVEDLVAMAASTAASAIIHK